MGGGQGSVSRQVVIVLGGARRDRGQDARGVKAGITGWGRGRGGGWQRYHCAQW